MADDGCHCRLTFGVIETSHVGIFDGALRGMLFGGNAGQADGGDGGMDDLLSIILPDGRLPNDLLIDFDPQPGFSLGFSSTQTLGNGMPVDIEGFVLADRNHFTVNAPTGLGILSDPTTLKVTADLAALGVLVRAPVWSGDLGPFGLTLDLGGGVMAYSSTTAVDANSVFLNVQETQWVTRLVPMLAGSVEVQANSRDDFSLDLGLRAFPTDNFWAGVVNAGLVVRF